LEAKILSEISTVSYPRPGEPQLTMAVTYQVGDRPPRTVWIPKDEYSEARLAQAIREDIEAAKGAGPRTISI